MLEKLFHICNLSSKIIFRNHDDYCVAINRLATCAFNTQTQIWAYSIMSTHFHLIVSGENTGKFICLYKSCISKWHNNKYSANISVQSSSRQLNNEFEITTAINYVLKNPVHHNVCELAFSYPYSSIYCYFPELFNDLLTMRKPTNLASELGARQLRTMFGRNVIPDNVQIIDKKIITPESFVCYRKVRYLYNSSRNFVFNMIKNMKEEEEQFISNDQASLNKFNRINLFGKMSDIEVCSIVDTMIAPLSYTQLNDLQRSQLWKHLRQQGVDQFQFERAV